MKQSNGRSMILGLAGGVGAAACAALLMGQGGVQPPGPRSDFFVTGEGSQAFLWQREGNNLRFVSQADSTRINPRPDPNRPPDRLPTDRQPTDRQPTDPRPPEPSNPR